jgi:hypothetical protein
MITPKQYTARRAIQSLRVWPGDHITVNADGSVELRRTLPPGAALAIHYLEDRGDLRPDEDEAFTRDTP